MMDCSRPEWYLTGGTSRLPKIRKLASEVLGLPVRVAQPENLIGLVDQLHSPAYSTSVGLLSWALLMRDTVPPKTKKSIDKVAFWENIKSFIRRFLP